MTINLVESPCYMELNSKIAKEKIQAGQKESVRST